MNQKICALCTAVNAPIASLLFDEVHVFYDLNTEEVKGTLKEYSADSLSFIFPGYKELSSIKTFGYYSCPDLEDNAGDYSLSFRQAQVTQQISGHIARQCRRGNLVIPLSNFQFIAEDASCSDHKAGFNACINHFPLIDREKLAWEQVIEIKNDVSSHKALIRLHSWLSDGFKAISTDHATGVIGQAIENYQDVTKKHGVATRLGIYETLLDWRLLGVLTGANTIAQFQDHELFGYLFSGAFTIGKVMLNIHQTNLDGKFVDKIENYRHIEYLYNIDSAVRGIKTESPLTRPKVLFDNSAAYKESQKDYDLWLRKKVSITPFSNPF